MRVASRVEDWVNAWDFRELGNIRKISKLSGDTA